MSVTYYWNFTVEEIKEMTNEQKLINFFVEKKAEALGGC
ncbi:hypothetical protein IGI37_001363 [Enterococcus sp. AZ194]